MLSVLYCAKTNDMRERRVHVYIQLWAKKSSIIFTVRRQSQKIHLSSLSSPISPIPPRPFRKRKECSALPQYAACDCCWRREDKKVIAQYWVSNYHGWPSRYRKLVTPILSGRITIIERGKGFWRIGLPLLTFARYKTRYWVSREIHPKTKCHPALLLSSSWCLPIRDEKR